MQFNLLYVHFKQCFGSALDSYLFNDLLDQNPGTVKH